MAGPKEYLDSFALLSRDTTEEQRKSLWRQGIATLARAAIAQQPVPLEGINPDLLLKAWRDLSRYPHLPEACLINYYSAGARMGLHQDRDEHDFAAPVVSLSLGDSCLLR